MSPLLTHSRYAVSLAGEEIPIDGTGPAKPEAARQVKSADTKDGVGIGLSARKKPGAACVRRTGEVAFDQAKYVQAKAA